MTSDPGFLFSGLGLLREHGCLAPTDDLPGREAVFVDHAKVPGSVTQNIFAWMRLEAK